MKLIINQIQKRMELGDNFALRKWYTKYVWEYGRAYAYALNVLCKKDLNVKKKNKLWKKFILSAGGIDSKLYIKFQNMMNEHSFTINQALEKMDKSSQKDVYSDNQIFKHTRTIAPIGVAAFEIEG